MFTDRPGDRPAISCVRFVAPREYGEGRGEWLRRTLPKGVPFPAWLPVALMPPPFTPECWRSVAPDPEEANAALRHTLDAIGAEQLREPSAWSLAHLLFRQLAPAAAARPSRGASVAPRLRDVRRDHARRQKAADLLGSPAPPAPARLRPVTRIGPVLPAVPIRRRITNPPSWETGMLYGAVYAAQVATAKRPLTYESGMQTPKDGPAFYRSGTQMPKDGRPLYAAAAAFLRDLSGVDLDPSDVGRQVHGFTTRNPGFRWWGWRHDASTSAVSAQSGS